MLLFLILFLCMYIIDYFWIQDFKTSKLYSQTNIVKLEKDEKLSNETIHLVPLVNVPNQYITLKPVYLIQNPFHDDEIHFIALCEVYNSDLPNNRLNCELTLTKHYPGDYLFDIEQEYIINDPSLRSVQKKVDENFLCVGDYFSKHRQFADKFVSLCVKVGIPLFHMMNEKYNRWIYGMKGLNGTKAGDVIWMTRYLLLRLSELETFNIQFGKLQMKINDIDNHDHFSTDPYLTIYVIISTIHKVKSEAEIEKIKDTTLSNTIQEQLRMKEAIREEAESLQNKLAETYKLDVLKQREKNELEKFNRIKEHKLHIEKLRREVQEAERNKLEREEQIQLQMLKRQQQEELERAMIAKEKEKQAIIEQEKEITDAELTRLRLLREELELKKNRELLQEEMNDKFLEREQIAEEIQQKELELEEEERARIQREKEEKEKREMEELEKMLDEDFNSTKK